MKKPPKLHSRNGIYHLRKRVPQRFASVERRSEVWISLKTDSLSEAKSKADVTWKATLAGWEALLAGDLSAAEQQMHLAKRIAEAHGFSYLSADRVAQLKLEELLERVEAAYDRQGRLNAQKAKAFLGGAEPPTLTLSKALELFWELTKDVQVSKTRDQLRVWRNHRKLSMRLIIEAVGDIELSELGPEELLDYRDVMWEYVESGRMKRGTANKRMGQAFAVLKTVNRMKRLGLILSFDGMRFADDDATTRPPFSDHWIRSKILKPGALDGLNVEARCILLGMLNTGYRPVEGANLRTEDIKLDGKIPFIWINDKHRKMKTAHSERVIPLTGVSLEAFRACPNGFPRYRDKAGLTALVNKYLKASGLRETGEHTMYGFRHSFEDRLLAADVDERIRRDLMGHKLTDRPKYGAGAKVEHLHRLLAPIALQAGQ